MSQLIKRELELNDVTSIRSTSGQIAKLSLLISIMKAKGSWCNCLAILWQPKESWSLGKDSYPSLDESDSEIKQEVTVNVTKTCSDSVLARLEERILDWTRMKTIVGIVPKYMQILKQKMSPPSDVLIATQRGVMDIELLEKTSIKIIKMLQQREFIEGLRIIKKVHKQNPCNNDQSTATKASPIYGLGPFLDDNGVLRMGGQLRNSSLNRSLMHPILLPRRSVITSKIIE